MAVIVGIDQNDIPAPCPARCKDVINVIEKACGQKTGLAPDHFVTRNPDQLGHGFVALQNLAAPVANNRSIGQGIKHNLICQWCGFGANRVVVD